MPQAGGAWAKAGPGLGWAQAGQAGPNLIPFPQWIPRAFEKWTHHLKSFGAMS